MRVSLKLAREFILSSPNRYWRGGIGHSSKPVLYDQISPKLIAKAFFIEEKLELRLWKSVQYLDLVNNDTDNKKKEIEIKDTLNSLAWLTSCIDIDKLIKIWR